MGDMTLKDTIEMMLSDDYKDRFKAEYLQTKIRYDKLWSTIEKAQAGTLDFKLNCPINMLREQANQMGLYLIYLENRAEIEGIDLKWQG